MSFSEWAPRDPTIPVPKSRCSFLISFVIGVILQEPHTHKLDGTKEMDGSPCLYYCVMIQVKLQLSDGKTLTDRHSYLKSPHIPKIYDRLCRRGPEIQFLYMSFDVCRVWSKY